MKAKKKPLKQQLKIARNARALITNKSNWTRRAYARTADDEEVDIESPDAVCFCANGALFKASGVTLDNRLPDVLPDVFKALGFRTESTLAAYNDNPSITHSHVLKQFDIAIGLLENRANA